MKSEAIATVIDANAALVGLEIPKEYRQGVIDNFARLLALAQPLMDFDLPEQTEIAPVFTP